MKAQGSPTKARVALIPQRSGTAKPFSYAAPMR